MASVAITGASGFIGVPLFAGLVERGHRVVRIAREPGPGVVSLDLRNDGHDWVGALGGMDAVVNLAGKAHDVRRHTPDQADEYRAVNALGAVRVARAAAENGARQFIQISTIKVLGDRPADGYRFREGDPLRPVGVYAESKAEGERLVAAALSATDTEGVIIRLPLVFGAPFKGNLASLEKAIRRGVPLPLGHRSIGRRSYVMMDDLVDLLISVIGFQGAMPPVLHARSADLTAAEVARMVGGQVGHPARIIPVPATILRAGSSAVRRPELASKLCDEMLVSDDLSRAALGLRPH